MPLLEVGSLKKYYATQKAVDDISFTIEKGSIFGLLGPNGAGKTTLIRMLTGIFYPDEGTILLNGKPFNPAVDVGSIGYMPEERGLYKKMRIGEQAVYLAQLKGLSESAATQKAREWFVKFEMQSWWNKKVEDLSKGMSQKLQFVITVLHEPQLIILDEPFSGLDPVNANLIRDEIHRLAAAGATIIFSTHRMEQVEEICDHILLVNKGRKVLDGTVKEVKQRYKENLFLLEFENDLGTEPAAAFFDIIRRLPQRMVVRMKEGHKPNELLQHFLNEKIPLTGFRELLPSLNDIFIKLVEGTPVSRQFEKKVIN